VTRFGGTPVERDAEGALERVAIEDVPKLPVCAELDVQSLVNPRR